MKRLIVIIFVTVVLLTGNSMILHGRSLYRQDMQVRALTVLAFSISVSCRLIVFSGSWNGDERLFLVRSGGGEGGW